MSAATAVNSPAVERKAASRGKDRRIMLLCENARCWAILSAAPRTQASLTHYLNNDAFRPLTVEFGIVNLLPGAKIEPAVRHRYNHLVMHDQALQVRIAIRLPGAMVLVVLAKRRQFLQPFVDVAQQAVFSVVYPDAGRNMHGRNQDHAFSNSALLQRGIHLACDVDVLAMLLGLELQIFGVKSHTPIIASPTSRLTHRQRGVRLESAIRTKQAGT